MSVITSSATAQDAWQFTLQSRIAVPGEVDRDEVVQRNQTWVPGETAIIVCDVWDYHHSENAVRRLKEFAPRLDQVLKRAREQGATIIHAPSDCMPAYVDHPARLRAQQTPAAERQPHDIAAWCSVIPSEEQAVYPVDQSDGGEDDDPAALKRWQAHLAELGRNPQLPWQRQSDLISIDDQQDYISDRGDEVWNILEQHGIRNVILTGVHVNMCVLGRPFGLRQMVRNGKNTVLMRDMTDTMYNPHRWPYVSHHAGTARIIAHIERFVCPTITSDQFLGGEPFQFSEETNTFPPETTAKPDHWELLTVPVTENIPKEATSAAWYRAVVYVPADWESKDSPFHLAGGQAGSGGAGWWNGERMESSLGRFDIPRPSIIFGDYNLLVLRLPPEVAVMREAPVLRHGTTNLLELSGRWQYRSGDHSDWSNMPLPVKFGGSSDIVFRPEEPLWVARPLTTPGEFTPGIEGPACDRDGNIYAVNYLRQGTIGRVTPQGVGEVFVTLPEGSIGNGIRFGADGSFFVADYPQHNVLRVDPKTRVVTRLAHNAAMNQPNDLAIANNGTLYASDPNWAKSTGQIWRIDPDGTTTLLASDLGTTNGIDLSPDERTLYVNESVQRNVWAFTITAEQQLVDKRLVRQFEDHGFDGMRTDVDGNLYITRYGKGTVVKMTPAGEILQEIDILGSRPSNLCFGGPDGRTVYVTEVEFTRLTMFRVDRPGREWRQFDNAPIPD